MTTAMPELDQSIEEHVTAQPDTPWQTLLWNDDVNTFDYVTLMLQRILKKPKEICEQHVFEAHSEGRSVVFSGTQEAAQAKAVQLGSATLWATVERG